LCGTLALTSDGCLPELGGCGWNGKTYCSSCGIPSLETVCADCKNEDHKDPTVKFTVSFNVNGGNERIASVDSFDSIIQVYLPRPTKTIGKTYILTLNPNGGECAVTTLYAPAQFDCEFLYWEDDISGTTYSGNTDEEFYADATLIAQWDAPEAISHTTVDLPTATRDGYTFAGWCLDPKGGTVYKSKYTVTTDTALYAMWKKNESSETNVTMYIKKDGTYKAGTAYIKKSGSWQKAKAVYRKVNGTWHKGK
jgi:uncharacterized repeat protein (TIGR02543 family)